VVVQVLVIYVVVVIAHTHESSQEFVLMHDILRLIYFIILEDHLDSNTKILASCEWLLQVELCEYIDEGEDIHWIHN
jgi:hypothetical protein